MKYGASQVMVKDLSASVGDEGNTGSTPGLGRSPGVGNGNPLQYSCLENPMDSVAWRTVVRPWGHQDLDTTEHTHTYNSEIYTPI